LVFVGFSFVFVGFSCFLFVSWAILKMHTKFVEKDVNISLLGTEKHKGRFSSFSLLCHLNFCAEKKQRTHSTCVVCHTTQASSFAKLPSLPFPSLLLCLLLVVVVVVVVVIVVVLFVVQRFAKLSCVLLLLLLLLSLYLCCLSYNAGLQLC